MKKFVYLAGPIENCDYAEINDWRNEAGRILGYISENQIITINPYRSEDGAYAGDYQRAMQIQQKNYYDTKNCDVILAYMPRVTLGTVFEVSWANILRKPIFIITDNPEIENHPVLKATTQNFFKDVTSACESIHNLIGVYT